MYVGTRNSGSRGGTPPESENGGRPWRGMRGEIRFQAEGNAPWFALESSGLMNNFGAYFNWNDSGTATQTHQETVVTTQSATPFTGGAQAGVTYDFIVTDSIGGYTFRVEYVSGLGPVHDGTWIQYDVTFERTHNNCDDAGPYNHVTFYTVGGAYLDDFEVRVGEQGTRSGAVIMLE
jgi:hypothetical protein